MSEKLIDIVVRVQQSAVGGALKNVENAVSSSTDTIRAKLAGVNGMLAGLGLGISTVALASFFKSSVAAAADAEAKINELRQAVENAGGEFDRLRPSLDDAANGLQKVTRYSDEAARGALATLVSISGDTRGSLRNLSLAADLAAAKHMDLNTAATLVGKAMAGNTALLGRYGIIVKDGADAIEVMRARFRGFAESDGATFQGRVSQIANAWDDMKEAIGNALVKNDEAGGVMVKVKEVVEDLTKYIDENADAWRRWANDVATSTVSAASKSWTMLAQIEGGLNLVAYTAERAGLALHAMFNLSASGRARDLARIRELVELERQAWEQLRTGRRAAASAPDDGDHSSGLPRTSPSTGGHSTPSKAVGDKAKDTRSAQLAELMAGFRLEEEAARGNADKIVEIRQRALEATRLLFKENSKEVMSARRELMRAEEDHRQQATRTAQQMIAMERDHMLASLAIEHQTIENKRQLGEISNLDAIERLKVLMEREYEIRLRAATAERDLLDQGTEAYRAADAKVRAIVDAHGVAVVAAQGQVALAIKATWDNVFAAVNNTFQTMINGVIQGTTTLKQGLSNLWFSIVQQFAAMGLKMVTSWASTELAKTGLTAQGAAARVAIESWAAIKSVAINSWAAIKNIAIYAASAIAAAWAAISAIPVVGPFLAPMVAIATGAAILALASRITSAERGYDIPAGLNPITQLHAREMVLPAEYADVIRGMAGKGGGAGSGGDVFNVHALDARSFERYLKENGATVAASIKQLARDGKLRMDGGS